MKKLTLVMLAVISMALISCGGGKNETKEGAKEETKVAKVYEPATPAFLYKAVEIEMCDISVRDCFEMKRINLAEAADWTVSVTVTLEALQDAPARYYSDGTFAESLSLVTGTIVLYDENMVEIQSESGDEYNENGGYAKFNNYEKKGDVCMMSAHIKYKDIASKILEKAKYVQIKNMRGSSCAF